MPDKIKEEEYNSYLDNENIQWFMHQLMNHESDKTSDGVVNYGGFNQGGSDSSAFGMGQYTGTTRNEILEKYNIDAWSDDLNTQMKAVIATLHMDGDLDHVLGGNFEDVFGESDLKTYTYPATKTNKETGEQEPHPNANQQYKLGGSRWQAFYPEGHRDFKAYEKHPKDILFGERTEGWKDIYNNQVSSAVFDPKSSFNKIANLDNGSDIQMKKRNLYTETYKDSLVPQYILDSIVEVEEVQIPKNNDDPGSVKNRADSLNLSDEEKLKIKEKSKKAVTGEVEIVQTEADKIKNDKLKQEQKEKQIKLATDVNKDLEKIVGAESPTHNYNKLKNELTDIDKKRNRRILQDLSVDAGRAPNEFFQSKEEYQKWFAENNPTLSQSKWKSVSDKYKDDDLTAYKRGELQRLDDAIKTVYDGDYDPNEGIRDEMRMEVLKQLTKEDVLRLNAEDRMFFLSEVLPGMSKTNKERIIDNARISIYNRRQEELGEDYDALMLDKKVMDDKTIVQRTLSDNIEKKSQELTEERDNIFSRGTFRYNVIGNINREQWYPEDIEEYVSFQDKVKEFDTELAMYNKQKAVYEIDLEEYNKKINIFKEKSEKNQVDLSYQIVDGMPVFDQSFKEWNASSREWQESLRDVLGKDNFLAKTADVIAAFVSPVAGMAADIATFGYQLGILGAAAVVDKMAGRDLEAGSNFDLVFQNMIRGGKVSNLIPVSQEEDSQFYDPKNKGTWFGKSDNGSLYKTAKLTSEMLAYPLVLIYGSKRSLMKKLS